MQNPDSKGTIGGIKFSCVLKWNASCFKRCFNDDDNNTRYQDVTPLLCVLLTSRTNIVVDETVMVDKAGQ